jgi:glycosyltransferase involved in cell wall biosynthesis
MKVSVVIPTFNEEKYIGKCLESLEKQIDEPDEIIIVDNNCTDRTIEIAKTFNVRIVKETTQGMIPARNAGFDAAQYEIIARCDADAILPVDWIKTIKENFSNSQIDGLTGPFEYYDMPLTSNNVVMSQLYLTSLKIMLRGNDALFGSNMIIKKSAWEAVSNDVCLDDKKVHEDVDLTIHMVKKGFKIKKDPKLLIKTSARRIKNKPHSFFIEYPIRMAKTFAIHI